MARPSRLRSGQFRHRQRAATRPHAFRGLVAADQTCSAHTRLKMPQRFAFPSCDKRKSCTKAVRARGRPCREARRALIKKRRDAAVAVDDAHLAADHIDQLREGVDTAVPKELSHPRRFPGPSWHSVFGIVHEGAEFQHLKTPARQACTSSWSWLFSRTVRRFGRNAASRLPRRSEEHTSE